MIMRISMDMMPVAVVSLSREFEGLTDEEEKYYKQSFFFSIYDTLFFIVCQEFVKHFLKICYNVLHDVLCR